ncbi:GNAT family N-acetyltransferase [Melittangium boletus]|uniref:GNAT family acetyltransferase n=1 Tax=Melittangium boletus DSM 14713 TaxID=1294270 RepID=A0A286NV87_9BACT|nr:GNAT family N-acetyltransferase [Melittangium boletus]ATB27014.1 GNAT family acetyltransferase [Melittangium boletus DSM 14713]
MTDIVIRVARPDDAGPLSVLGWETFLDTFVKGFGIPYPEEDLATFFAQSYTPEAYARVIADPSRRVWLAERGGEGVAYVTAGNNALPHPEARPGEGELKALYVRRELHGSGLAPRLMDTALAWLDPEGGRRLWLGVWSGNLRAQRFYARYGFHKAGEYEFPVGRVRDREFILRRG